MRVKQALLDPASIFKDPQDVLLSQELTRDQKIQILRRWSYEIRELQVAEEENMQGKTQVDLQSVLNALRTLGAVIDLEREPPTKQGGGEE